MCSLSASFSEVAQVPNESEREWKKQQQKTSKQQKPPSTPLHLEVKLTTSLKSVSTIYRSLCKYCKPIHCFLLIWHLGNSQDGLCYSSHTKQGLIKRSTWSEVPYLPLFLVIAHIMFDHEWTSSWLKWQQTLGFHSNHNHASLNKIIGLKIFKLKPAFQPF